MSVVWAAGQTTAPNCPVISVAGPQGITDSGDTIVFRAQISGLFSRSITYEWKVSGERTFDGQGTDSIRIHTTREDGNTNITATVTIKGLPERCAANASEVAGVAAGLVCDMPADEYGRIPWLEEQARLDNFLIHISQDPGYSGIVHMKIKVDESVGSAKEHARRMLNHFKRRDKNFDPGRLLFAIEVSDDGPTTTFRIIAKDSPLPTCTDACILLNSKEL